VKLAMILGGVLIPALATYLDEKSTTPCPPGAAEIVKHEVRVPINAGNNRG